MANPKSLYERIEYWLLNGSGNIESKLNDDDYEIFKRWRFVHLFMQSKRPVITRQEAINALKNTYRIEERQANYDINNAQKLFGKASQLNRDWELAFYVDWLKQLASIAEANKDVKGAVEAIKKASDLVLHLTKDQPDQTFAHLPAVFQFIIENSGTKGQLPEGNEPKVIDITNLQRNKQLDDITEAIQMQVIPKSKIEDMLRENEGE